MIRTIGVAHLSIPVTDPERSLAFYRDVLGMKLLANVQRQGMVFLDSGGDCVILVKVDQPISTARDRNVHHSFVVAHDHYAESVAELKRLGIAGIDEEDMRGGVVNGPRTYFHDPDGNVLEIIDLTSYKGDHV